MWLQHFPGGRAPIKLIIAFITDECRCWWSFLLTEPSKGFQRAKKSEGKNISLFLKLRVLWVRHKQRKVNCSFLSAAWQGSQCHSDPSQGHSVPDFSLSTPSSDDISLWLKTGCCDHLLSLHKGSSPRTNQTPQLVCLFGVPYPSWCKSEGREGKKRRWHFPQGRKVSHTWFEANKDHFQIHRQRAITQAAAPVLS